MDSSLAIFETYKIRRHYDEEKEIWFFSVIDIVAVLIEQKNFKKAQSYWTTLKNRLKNEGNQFVTKCDKLKMKSSDGKFYKTELAELSTRRIAKTDNTVGFEENKTPAKKGGKIARDARLALEEKTGKKVVSANNFKKQINS